MGMNSDLEPLSQGRDSETNIWENCSNQRQAKRQRANQNAMFTLWRILQIIVVFSKRSRRIRLQDFAQVSSKISMFIPGNSIFFAQIFVMSADVFFPSVCVWNKRNAVRVPNGFACRTQTNNCTGWTAKSNSCVSRASCASTTGDETQKGMFS